MCRAFHARETGTKSLRKNSVWEFETRVDDGMTVTFVRYSCIGK